MNTVYPIAIITFKEGIRNKAMYGIALFALMVFCIDLLIANMAPRDIGKVAVDVALSAISFAGLMLILFVGINLMAKDLDRRTIYTVLSRPVSRSEYIVGKFLGMLLLIAASTAVLSVFGLLTIALLKAGYVNYFERFNWYTVFLAIAFIMMMLVVLSALSFLFASFSSTSFITLILTIISYVIGHSLNDVKALAEAPQRAGIEVSPSVIKLVKAAYYLFPNFSFFDIKTQAAHGLPVSVSYIVYTFSYGIIYSCLAVTLAALIFRKKEFP